MLSVVLRIVPKAMQKGIGVSGRWCKHQKHNQSFLRIVPKAMGHAGWGSGDLTGFEGLGLRALDKKQAVTLNNVVDLVHAFVGVKGMFLAWLETVEANNHSWALKQVALPIRSGENFACSKGSQNLALSGWGRLLTALGLAMAMTMGVAVIVAVTVSMLGRRPYGRGVWGCGVLLGVHARDQLHGMRQARNNEAQIFHRTLDRTWKVHDQCFICDPSNWSREHGHRRDLKRPIQHCSHDARSFTLDHAPCRFWCDVSQGEPSPAGG
eukprot:CAMPEP_0175980150 /NCGR_PEP_ID=MMETSP0108-20121206/46641_1 /TAXON_ID=195067 ORGANISM="Goniomonas pacifica, Strain CCMP1869" /NCGR_SAMPLE_ID=MMETSP0108 /ASSEMBLY_ACC=CAM_ASM_000204 /LENGTH=265 /DNA_ID=CAMNT_0017310579 /DNA_START=237 /DNA_END=1030 /DNA_ORIENTATION=+